MSQQSCSKPQVDRVRVASYLIVGVTGAMMASDHSDAAVVAIDLTNVNGQNITGLNGGVTPGNKLIISNWLGTGTGELKIYNGYDPTFNVFGLAASAGLTFAINAPPSPRNFGAGATIDGSAAFSGNAIDTIFEFGSTGVPDFGANSFMGFRFGSAGNYNYGYLEVTWTDATNTFQILSGAWETTANTQIITPSAVPGAGLSAMALMALGGGAFRRRSRGRVA